MPMDKILVPLSIGYGEAIMGLGRLTDRVTDFFEKPEDFKLVLFTGGADVMPELYGDSSPRGMCQVNPGRDAYEIPIFQHALKHGIKITGICRGAQFINVMSGGRLMHNIDRHAGCGHPVETSQGEVFLTNSLHHQMIIPPDDGLIVAWSQKRLSLGYVGRHDKMEKYKGPETEAFIISRTACCGVQWHPEMMDPKTPGYQYYFNMVKNFLELDIDAFVKMYCSQKTMGA
jgi:GMP synthase-like glutamine amidotransferase